MAGYTVFVDENSHHGDDEGHYRHGEFDTLEAALTAAHGVVDAFLRLQFRAGMTAEGLFELYGMFGEEPYIVGPEGFSWSGRDYARQRCAELTMPRGGAEKENEKEYE